MKILNFTATEVLPSLLNKSKTQTIRPAWKDYPVKDGVVNLDKGVRKYKVSGTYGKDNWKVHTNKPPRFKIGEQVKLLWNQRSKYKWFCYYCGKGLKVKIIGGFEEMIPCHTHSPYATYNLPPLDSFNKLLGTVEITEVFKIEMGYGNAKGAKPVPYIDHEDGARTYIGLLDNCLPKLSKKLQQINRGRKLYAYDGFRSAESMFKYLDKTYDLSQSKEFYVYRWVWAKPTKN